MKISTGTSRSETNWAVKNFSWSEFVERLRIPVKTNETFAEYQSYKKEKQDAIKDVGGYVGGPVSGGRRKKGSVNTRQIITLDIDAGPANFWTHFLSVFSCTAVLYSTHSHNPEKPRYRLVIPLDREVSADEYVAIARKIADKLNIEFFDPTTFQVERLMYWPSISRDATYIFFEQYNKILVADTILKLYKNWKDVSEWPHSVKVTKLIAGKTTEAEDPLTKKGIIGVFCRTYTLTAAIEEFLPDAYVPGTIPGRYTYTGGSTANGLVVYQDKWCYSHHATDPVSGRLCNAFDLVRIHKYGHLDADAKEDTPINKMPSFLEINDLIINMPEIKQAIGKETLASAYVDFHVDDIDWLQKLDINKSGKYLDTVNNIDLIISNDPYLKECFAFNQFTERNCIIKKLPWRDIKNNIYWTDTDSGELRMYIENHYKIENRYKIKDVLNAVFTRIQFHPVRNYLNPLVWDNKKRIDTILIDYFGAEDTQYIRTISRKTMIAGVARIMNPGCKFDNVLMLISPQGYKKSTFIETLAGEWFSDNFGTIANNRAAENLQGVWIMEIGELAGLKRAEIEDVKHFISRREDTFRAAYAENISSKKRQSIFIATTNDFTPLRDQTGGRRFWPVQVEKQLTDKIPRDQLWAEAVAAYNDMEKHWLDDEMESHARLEQEQYTEVYALSGLVEKYLDTLIPPEWEDWNIGERLSYLEDEKEIKKSGTQKKEKVCVAEIWCEALAKNKADLKQFNTREINQFMLNLKNWRKGRVESRVFKLYGRQRYFERF